MEGSIWRRLFAGLVFFWLIFAVSSGMPVSVHALDEHHGEAGKPGSNASEKPGGPGKAEDRDWVEEKTGDYLPLDTEFTDSNGKKTSLRALITRPTLILPIYFYCPNTCSLNLSYLAEAIKASTLKPLTDFQVIAFSFNPEETVEDASNAKGNYLKELPENFPARAWTFMVGSPENVKALTEAIGFRYTRMADGTFVHPSALVAVSSQGRIIQYVYGSFLSGDVDLALLAAKKGVPSLSVKRFLGFCFNNDTKTSDTILKRVKVSLLLCSLVLGGLFVVFLRRSGKKRNISRERQI